MEEAGWALGTCAWSKGTGAALFQSIAIMEECQASKSQKFSLCDISKCLNVGIKFRLLFQYCIFYPPPSPSCHESSWPMCHPFVMQRTLEKIALEDPSLEGNEGKKEVRFPGLYFGGRGRAEGGQSGHRKQTSFNTVVLGWPGPLHFKSTLSENKLWQLKSHLFE